MAHHLRHGADAGLTVNIQSPRRAPHGQKLCAIDDIPDGRGKGLTVDGADGPFEIFVVRNGAAIHAYVNSCPHVGTPLDWAPDQFMDSTGGFIMCATHGALFEIANGACVSGPCAGARLQRVPIEVHDGTVRLVKT